VSVLGPLCLKSSRVSKKTPKGHEVKFKSLGKAKRKKRVITNYKCYPQTASERGMLTWALVLHKRVLRRGNKEKGQKIGEFLFSTC